MMSDHKGAALVVAIMAVALLSALGLSLAVLTDTEVRVASNYAQAYEARNAAEVGLELAVRELLAIADWSGVMAGTTMSAFVDGAPGGERTLSDGASLNLEELTANLGDPGWRLFAYGPLSSLASVPSTAYIVVWVGPDPAGKEGVLALRADAFGPSGTRRAVQAAVSPSSILSWKEVR
jgi:hypothetical protein